MEKINFDYNWNNKLGCKAFITFRVLSPKYKIGEMYQITFKNKPLFIAKLVDMKVLRVEEVNNWISFLDTGYDVVAFQNIVKKIYKDLDKKFCLLLLKKEVE